VLATLFAPLRFPLHGLQMCTAYIGQMAPSSYITNCAAFAAADLLRRLSLVAYRTRELQRAFPELGFGTQERTRWETDAGWQAVRESIELALTAYDWAESFTAVNLVLRPALDDVWLRQLAELARLHHDEETWLLLSGLRADAERCGRWTTALARHAVARRAENRAVLRAWIDRWAPRARAATAAYGEALARALDGAVPATSIAAAADAARDRMIAEIGLD
jgi:toluene monooxygenase system protein E